MSPSTRASSAAQPTIIAVIGGINMDLLMKVHRAPDVGESMDALSLAQLPGGKGANTAVAAYRASHRKPSEGNAAGGQDATGSAARDRSQIDVKVCMNGAVGDDPYGTELKARLTEVGVDIAGVRTIPGVSSNVCVVLVETDNGDSRNVGYPAANLHWALPPSGSLASLGDGVMPDLIVTSLVVPREQVERVLEIAGKQGIDTLLNPSSPEYLVSGVYRHLTHLVMNESETAMLFGRPLSQLTGLAAYKEAGNHFLDLGVENVVITLGAKGAYFITHKGDSGLVEAEKDIEVVDTTGAG
jgi:ribokinase